MQGETHYLGMVVTEGGSLLADLPVHGGPSVNDLATLLANALLVESRGVFVGS